MYDQTRLRHAFSEIDRLVAAAALSGLFDLRLDVTLGLDDQIADLENQIEGFVARLEELDGSEDELTDEDEAEISEIEGQIEKAKKILNRKRTIKNARDSKRSRGRRAAPGDGGERDENGNITVPAQVRNAEEAARHGFRSFGEFALMVGRSGKSDAEATTRLNNAATTYGSESSGADGGFAVPPEFRTMIWEKVTGTPSLMSRCTPMETAGNSLTIPKDETTPWDNASGVQVYWTGEADQVTQTKPELETANLRLNKLMALVPMTEELMEDAPGLESWLRSKLPTKMVAKINTAIVRGTGAGQPKGIINSDSIITVTKEVSQDAASVLMPNINNMWNRLFADLRSNAIWLINQEVEPQLEGMQFIPANEHGTATSNVNFPVYLPAGGLADTPFARLKGRPVVPVPPCSALGSLGDIILTDLSQYTILTKAGAGMQEAVSMHFFFDQGINAFRMTFRVTGEPMWNNVIDPEQGSNTYSWAVVLEDRS